MYVVILGGTPGTGKTSVARRLSQELDCAYVNATDLLRDVDGLAHDPTGRLTMLATDEGLERASRLLIERAKRKCIILDTVFPREWFDHLEYYVATVVLLRCNPVALMKRLSKRDWPLDKVVENALAEAFGIIAESLLDISYDVIEIDTTSTSPMEAVSRVFGKLLDWETGIKIDWLADPQVESAVIEWSLRLDRDKYRLGVGGRLK